MSDPKNRPINEARQRWVKGKSETGTDELARRAKSGRSLLGSEAEAGDLLAEVDAELDDTYGSSMDQGRQQGKRIKLYIPKKRWFALAAAVVGLLIAGWWLTGEVTIDGPGLYATNFEHFENELVVRKMGEAGVADPELAAAFVGYERQDYERAVKELKAYVETTPQADPRAIFYLGISELAVGDIPVAREYLELALRKNYQPDAARWYLALAGLKDNNLDLSRRELKQLANGNSLFKTKAANLLEKINKH